MTDAERIRRDVLARGVTRVVHGTQSRNLPHILGGHGIQASDVLKQQAPDIFRPNDQQRYDCHEGHISCSVEFPNYWFLRKAAARDELFKDWVLLFVSPIVLERSGTLFCPRNASAQHGMLLAPGAGGFAAMFVPSVIGAGGKTWTRTTQMLSAAPTDDQAEVMVHGHIAANEIAAVAVPSEQSCRLEQKRLQQLGVRANVEWVVAPALFDGQVSWMVRAGRRPSETRFDNSGTRI